MNALLRLALIIALASVATVTTRAGAQPASSAQSAWTDSTLKPDQTLRDPLARRGREVFQARCAACHGAYPQGTQPSTTSAPGALPPMPGTTALAIKYQGSKPAVLEQRTDLTPELVALFVRKGTGIMAPLRPTEVSNADLKALGAYLSRKRQ